jgi:hypothetical protein
MIVISLSSDQSLGDIPRVLAHYVIPWVGLVPYTPRQLICVAIITIIMYIYFLLQIAVTITEFEGMIHLYLNVII